MQVLNTHLGLVPREQQIQARCLAGDAWLGDAPLDDRSQQRHQLAQGRRIAGQSAAHQDGGILGAHLSQAAGTSILIVSV